MENIKRKFKEDKNSNTIISTIGVTGKKTEEMINMR